MSRRNPTPEDWVANSLPFEKALSTIFLDYDFLYQHFFSRLFEDALHILTIKKPPDSVNYDFLMMCIVLLGRTVFFKHDSKLIAMNAAPAGKPDLYYVPSRIMVTNPRFIKSYNLTPGEDCEVVYCTSLDPYYWGRGSGGMYGLISTTASLLADNYLSLNIAQKNLRLTNAFAADDLNTKESLEACMEEAYEGRPFLVVQKSLVDKLETLPMHSDSSNQTLIQLLAEQGRTLYLNFESFSGLNALVRPAFDSSLEEVLFLLPDQADKLSSKLAMITRPVGGADAAPPVRNYESLREIREEEWLSLIDAAVKWTDYRFLVLDLESLQGLTQILKKCDLIYVLQQEQDLFSEPKMEEFEQALRERDCQELLLRTRVWKVPPLQGSVGEDLRGLLRQPYAGLMREQVKKDAQELRRDTGDRT